MANFNHEEPEALRINIGYNHVNTITIEDQFNRHIRTEHGETMPELGMSISDLATRQDESSAPSVLTTLRSTALRSKGWEKQFAGHLHKALT